MPRDATYPFKNFSHTNFIEPFKFDFCDEMRAASPQEGEGDPVRPDLCDDLIPPGEVSDSAEPDAETAADGDDSPKWKNLIRLEGDPVECPFPGEFTFKYTKGVT